MGGCSDDDETPGFDDSTSPGDSIKWNKIIMEINTAGKQTVRLNVYGGGETEANLKIDWGDGNKSEDKFTINEEHVYSEGKNYTITVTGNDISGFNCPNLNIISLNLSNCTGLVSLNCYNSNLTILDLSRNTSLVNLCCYGNKLTSLNLEGATRLNYLDCNSNQLTSLDVSRNTGLEYINCNYNKLTALDVSNNIELSHLYCTDNQIEALDFTCNARIRQIYCSNNQLSQEAYEILYASLPMVNDNSATLWIGSDAPGAYDYLAKKGWGFNRWP